MRTGGQVVKDDRGKDNLKTILALGVLVIGLEGWGLYRTGNLMLFQNLTVGICECLLLSLNLLGFYWESKGWLRIGSRVAEYSDVVFAVVFAVDGSVGLYYFFTRSHNPIDAKTGCGVAAVAAGVDFFCALLCTANRANDTSARFKLWAGSLVGAITSATYGIIWKYDLYFLDSIMTSVIAVGIVAAVAIILPKRRRDQQRRQVRYEQELNADLKSLV